MCSWFSFVWDANGLTFAEIQGKQPLLGPGVQSWETFLQHKAITSVRDLTIDHTVICKELGWWGKVITDVINVHHEQQGSQYRPLWNCRGHFGPCWWTSIAHNPLLSISQEGSDPFCNSPLTLLWSCFRSSLWCGTESNALAKSRNMICELAPWSRVLANNIVNSLQKLGLNRSGLGGSQLEWIKLVTNQTKKRKTVAPGWRFQWLLCVHVTRVGHNIFATPPGIIWEKDYSCTLFCTHWLAVQPLILDVFLQFGVVNVPRLQLDLTRNSFKVFL